MKNFNKMLVTLLLSFLLIPTSYGWEPDKNKPIRLVMATTPGSSSDVVTRAIGKSLSDNGFQVIYEYKTGVGGILAANEVHGSPKDGHTLLSVLATGMFMTPDLYYPGARKYEWEKFELVSILSKNPSILIGKNSVEADTVSKILEVFRSTKEEKFSIGHGPGGGLAQVEKFLAAANYNKNKDIVRVPYKGPKEAAMDVASGSLDYSIVVMPSPYGLIETNKVKAIAVTSPKRLAKLPNVPTVSETIKGFSLTGINGVALPEGTNKEIVDFYVKHFVNYMKGKEYQTILDNAFLTLDADEMGPTAFKNTVKESINDTLPVLIKAAENQKKKQ